MPDNTDPKRWWLVEAAGKRIGRVHATKAELRNHLGDGISFSENGLVTIMRRPS